MDELIPALLAQANFRPPYAFLGHSLGALIAFETARALRERGLPGPDLLHVSGTGAPHLQDPDRGIHELPSEQLLDVMQRRYGAVPPEIRADPELIELILPGLRADLAVVATYRHRPGEPLDCPLLITGGTADDSVTEQALAAWSAYTTAGSTLRMFPGDHFYLREAPGFGPLLAENLRAALP
jgi:surfactin synthase thioesterase subunit